MAARDKGDPRAVKRVRLKADFSQEVAEPGRRRFVDFHRVLRLRFPNLFEHRKKAVRQDRRVRLTALRVNEGDRLALEVDVAEVNLRLSQTATRFQCDTEGDVPPVLFLLRQLGENLLDLLVGEFFLFFGRHATDAHAQAGISVGPLIFDGMSHQQAENFDVSKGRRLLDFPFGDPMCQTPLDVVEAVDMGQLARDVDLDFLQVRAQPTPGLFVTSTGDRIGAMRYEKMGDPFVPFFRRVCRSRGFLMGRLVRAMRPRVLVVLGNSNAILGLRRLPMFVRVFELDVVERAVGSLLQGCHLRLSLSHFLQKCANALNYPKIFGILFCKTTGR